MSDAEAAIARAIEVFAAINFLVTGLSHLLAPRAWARFFIQLRERGEPGVFVVAFLSLGFGSLIVSLHNVWYGLPAALTVYGWSQVLKSILYMAFPAIGLRVLARIDEDRSGRFRVAGLALLALGVLMAVHLMTTR